MCNNVLARLTRQTQPELLEDPINVDPGRLSTTFLTIGDSLLTLFGHERLFS